MTEPIRKQRKARWSKRRGATVEETMALRIAATERELAAAIRRRDAALARALTIVLADAPGALDRARAVDTSFYGTVLQPEPLPVKAPWWRRLLRRGRK